MCTIGTASVRTIIVKKSPATASGTATAIADATPLTPCPPNTKMIADATDANAASGATAAQYLPIQVQSFEVYRQEQYQPPGYLLLNRLVYMPLVVDGIEIHLIFLPYRLEMQLVSLKLFL